MATGELVYENGRLDLQFSDGSFMGGFHCGDYIELLINGNWLATRVEFCGDWYLVGLYEKGNIPSGLTARTTNHQA